MITFPLSTEPWFSLLARRATLVGSGLFRVFRGAWKVSQTLRGVMDVILTFLSEFGRMSPWNINIQKCPIYREEN